MRALGAQVGGSCAPTGRAGGRQRLL